MLLGHLYFDIFRRATSRIRLRILGCPLSAGGVGSVESCSSVYLQRFPTLHNDPSFISFSDPKKYLESQFPYNIL